MKKILLLFLSISMFFACAPEQKEQKEDKKQQTQKIDIIHKGNVDFDAFFKNKTMRLDYFHTGNSATEHFAVDKILSDGPWHGSKNVLIDELELGPYFFEVIDKETNQLLYSRGFASIFGEWQTIPEAKEVWGTFHESIRFPWPLKPVTVIVKKRDANYDFQPIWTTDIDPDNRQVNPADIKHTEEVVAIHESGDPNKKLDIVLLGDGYTQEEMDKFVADAKRATGYLLSVEPYKSRKDDMNVWAVKTPSQVSGISRPHPGIYKRTALSAHYSSFDSERYVLSYDNKTIRDVASAAPYEFTSILVNERTYGGGGIYKLYTTLAADNKFAKYLMVHEMGHHMAALADEYYSSAVSYEAPSIEKEPWETNITALLDKDNLKWKDLVKEDTPIPTPWNKEEFDEFSYEVQKKRTEMRAQNVEESVMEDFFMDVHHKQDEFFAEEKYQDVVGAFEGAGYNQYGLYRSQLDCIMFTRHTNFCKVCQRSISEVIDQYSK